jgi:hypothetical protein
LLQKNNFMALNVLYTTLLPLQQRPVWQSLLLFFIFPFFVFYLSTIVGRHQTSVGRHQTGVGHNQASVGRRQTSVGRHQTSGGCRQASDGRRQTGVGRHQASAGRNQTSGGNLPTLQQNKHNTPFIMHHIY